MTCTRPYSKPQESSRAAVAVYQGFPVSGQVRANIDRAISEMERAAQQSARLIIFPEMFLTGYMIFESLPGLALEAVGPEIEALRAAARRLNLVTVVGFPELAADGSIYNSACVIDATGDLAGVHRKVHLFGEDASVFEAGSDFTSYPTAVGRLGVAICYDIEFPETARELVLDGADLIVVPTANMEPYADVQAFTIRSRAWENGVPILLANQVGQDEYFTYFGGSCIIDGWAEVLASAGSAEALIVVELSMGAAPPHRRGYLSRRRPGAYTRLIGGSHSDCTEPRW